MARIGRLAGYDIDALWAALRPRILGLAAGGTVGAQGPAGPKGVVWRGAWAADTDYNEGDIVTDMTDPGTSPLTFFCLTDHTSLPGVPPTVGGDTNWHEINAGYLFTDGSRPYVLAPTHTQVEGCAAWNSTSGLRRLLMDVNSTSGLLSLPLAAGIYIHVQNDSGVGLAELTPIYVSSTDEPGNRLSVERLLNSQALNDTQIVGLTMHAIADGEDGLACVWGYLGGVDTSAFGAGGQLYVTGGGALAQDGYPNKGCGARIRMGSVIVAANSGSMWVSPDWRPDLDELSNVSVGEYAVAKQYYDVPMWLPRPGEAGCDAWRDFPAARFPSVSIAVGDSPYDIAEKDVVVLVDASAGDVTVNLPQLVDRTQGRLLRVKLIEGPFKATIVRAAPGETIDGDVSVSLLTKGESLDIQADADSLWRIL